MIKIFTKVNCANCPKAKELGKVLEKKGCEVVYYDIDTVEGLTEASYFNIMSTPSVILINETTKKTWLGKVPELNEILTKKA